MGLQTGIPQSVKSRPTSGRVWKKCFSPLISRWFAGELLRNCPGLEVNRLIGHYGSVVLHAQADRLELFGLILGVHLGDDGCAAAR